MYLALEPKNLITDIYGEASCSANGLPAMGMPITTDDLFFSICLEIWFDSKIPNLLVIESSITNSRPAPSFGSKASVLTTAE